MEVNLPEKQVIKNLLEYSSYREMVVKDSESTWVPFLPFVALWHATD